MPLTIAASRNSINNERQCTYMLRVYTKDGQGAKVSATAPGIQSPPEVNFLGCHP
jgi:hypothetical protein